MKPLRALAASVGSTMAAALAMACPALAQNATAEPAPRRGLQDPVAERVKTINACLRYGPKAESRNACIGRVVLPCRREDGDMIDGARGCLSSELEAWRRILDDSKKPLLKDANDEVRARMERSDAAWQAYLREACELPHAVFPGGRIASTLVLDCLVTSTAIRAIQFGEIASWKN